MINRSPLVWAGSKASIINKIKAHLPPAKRLVEPFIGSGTVFLNTDYETYLSADINYHLVDTLNGIRADRESLLKNLKWYFENRNCKEHYLATRKYFNDCVITNPALFIYLNRHCFNGLCRYNRKGDFNVPWGGDKKEPRYLPEKEILFFAEKAKKTNTIFRNQDFQTTIAQAVAGDVIYCDPPYLPESETANFTNYYAGGFVLNDHLRLIDSLKKAVDRGCHVVVSNSLPAAKIYQDNGFTVHEIEAPRTISCKGKERKPVTEIVAVMEAAQ